MSHFFHSKLLLDNSAQVSHHQGRRTFIRNGK